MGQPKNRNKKNTAWLWIVLHLMLAVYALSTVFSKFAAQEEHLTFRFFLFYGLVILLLGLYAIGWQQIIKRLPLTVAYANKAVSVIWGCIYGMIFFKEKLNTGKIIGGLLVVAGVVLFALSDTYEKTTGSVNDKTDDKIADDIDKTEGEGV